VSDQVALVTGGSRGVGLAIADSLRAAGIAVSAGSRSTGVDVTQRESVHRAVRETEAELGPITLLVNNAGTLGPIGPAWDADPADWWRDVETTLLGAFNCTQAVMPGMVERRQGRIVNVSSYAAIRPSPYLSSYAAAKAALVSFTEALAGEAAEHGISVFAVSPGRVRTAMTEHIAKAGRRWLGGDEEAQWVEPELAGKLVVFIASGAADGLSGRFLHVLDDWDGLARRADEVRREDLYALRLRR
jgi:NAD(P)-dependent dehydrogenase (short-subunit alcohol dehydrogenase family)